jgi:hypothetical protein
MDLYLLARFSVLSDIQLGPGGSNMTQAGGTMEDGGQLDFADTQDKTG